MNFLSIPSSEYLHLSNRNVLPYAYFPTICPASGWQEIHTGENRTTPTALGLHGLRTPPLERDWEINLLSIVATSRLNVSCAATTVLSINYGIQKLLLYSSIFKSHIKRIREFYAGTPAWSFTSMKLNTSQSNASISDFKVFRWVKNGSLFSPMFLVLYGNTLMHIYTGLLNVLDMHMVACLGSPQHTLLCRPKSCSFTSDLK